MTQHEHGREPGKSWGKEALDQEFIVIEDSPSDENLDPQGPEAQDKPAPAVVNSASTVDGKRQPRDRTSQEPDMSAKQTAQGKAGAPPAAPAVPVAAQTACPKDQDNPVGPKVVTHIRRTRRPASLAQNVPASGDKAGPLRDKQAASRSPAAAREDEAHGAGRAVEEEAATGGCGAADVPQPPGAHAGSSDQHLAQIGASIENLPGWPLHPIFNDTYLEADEAALRLGSVQHIVVRFDGFVLEEWERVLSVFAEQVKGRQEEVPMPRSAPVAMLRRTLSRYCSDLFCPDMMVLTNPSTGEVLLDTDLLGQENTLDSYGITGGALVTLRIQGLTEPGPGQHTQPEVAEASRQGDAPTLLTEPAAAPQQQRRQEQVAQAGGQGNKDASRGLRQDAKQQEQPKKKARTEQEQEASPQDLPQPRPQPLALAADGEKTQEAGMEVVAHRPQQQGQQQQDAEQRNEQGEAATAGVGAQGRGAEAGPSIRRPGPPPPRGMHVDPWTDTVRPMEPVFKKKKYWEAEETRALLEGIRKHGSAWKSIEQEYGSRMRSRKDTDCKDRWANLVRGYEKSWRDERGIKQPDDIKQMVRALVAKDAPWPTPQEQQQVTTEDEIDL